jgi:hypothetical protein
MGYFTVEVKPLVPASTQNAGAFTAGDLLFDWKEFEIPRGGAKLVGVTALVRPKGDAGPTPNNFGIDLIFGKVGTSLGTVNAVFGLTTPQEDILGSVNIATSNFTGPNSAASTSCVSVGSVSGVDMVISPDVTALNTGTNVGYDKFYVAGIANGAIDFTSVIANTEDLAAEHADSKTITTDGSCSPIELFLPGDVIHIGTSTGTPAADSLYGTLLTADSATQITLEAVSETALVDGDVLFNINPIKLLLHFEK